MSTDFKRISRNAISALGVTSLLAASLVVTSPATAQAEEQGPSAATLSDELAGLDGTITSMNRQAASLQGQIGQTNEQITKLESEQAALKVKLEEKKDLLKQTVRDTYVAGDPSSVEVIASNESFSGVVGQQHYRDQVGEKTGKAAEEVANTQQQIDEKVADAKKKRDGLQAMKGQLDGKIAAAKAQEEAKAALQEITQNNEEHYQEMRRQQTTQAVVTAVAPRSGASGYNPGGGGSVPGLMGTLGYAKPGGNCVNEPGVNNPGFGNPINWPVLSQTPSIGATALWTYNHTGVVTGIWSNGDVEVRHQNFYGGQTRFPRGAFRGFR